MPDSCDLFLTSVQKKMDIAVFDSIKSVVEDSFDGGVYTGTLENDGVGIPELGDDVDRPNWPTRSTSTARRSSTVAQYGLPELTGVSE